ncbi:GNAT family N-acetyltransferase [Glaciibacter sp. 2TAF33]|uniref:GNAT family N-acetyltransferase n=1 Tax=Glaciibacter sp. 2TAF33 TaxID=3233015 RepID=UPI003F9095DB
MTDFSAVPPDPESTRFLAGAGLELGLIDNADTAAARRWLLAETQGFHDRVPNDERITALLDSFGDDRVTGVWDPSAADPASPVATVRTWVMDLTVPGGDVLPAWAISSVTVAPTHRRRGIARALLGGELRTAQRAGLPIAMLTVSEATIYARYGFAPSAYRADYSIDTARARFLGPVPAGRVHLVTPASLLSEAPGVFARARQTSPGEVDRRDDLWRKILGLFPPDEEDTNPAMRAVRYDDESGRLQGYAVYRFVHGPGGYPGRLEISDLVAATDEASAALWRYVLEMDLVNEVRAPLRRTRETVSWQVSDYRSVRKTDERDHLWLRILDLPAALERRTYAADGTFALTVDDPLGLIGGTYLLAVRDGRASAHPLPPGAAPTDAIRLSLSAADLAALYLGATGAQALAAAGRITEGTTDAAARLDNTFHSPYAPWLSTWF